MKTFTTILALALLSACSATPQPARTGEFTHEGLRWESFSDGSFRASDGNETNTDPRLPLCSSVTLTADQKRLDGGKHYARECRVR